MATTRRKFLTLAAAVGLAPGARRAASVYAAGDSPPPVRAITKGPKYHWFGYYDKFQSDPTDRYLLGMEIDFVDRDPRPDDLIRIGMVDLADGDRWIELGQSRAWCWQQGCMLQWRPGSDSEILWNDRSGDHWVCHVLDVFTGKQRTIPHAIYAVSPDGRTAVTVDYGRLWRLAPGYGYNGVADANEGYNLPEDDGVWQVNLETGDAKLIVTFHDVVKLGEPIYNMANSPNYFKHLLFSPDGSRFIFLQRWMPRWPNRDRFTRMLTANHNGSDLRIVDDSGGTSHFIWRDPQHILAWTRLPSHGSRFYLFNEPTGVAEVISPDVMKLNGHCSYLPGNEWILNDTYPQGKERMQDVYLYHVPTGRVVSLGRFHSPTQY
ncbi:MAG: hypothetical protein ACR2NM_08545, partial [Bythopirellula sp.]